MKKTSVIFMLVLLAMAVLGCNLPKGESSASPTPTPTVLDRYVIWVEWRFQKLGEVMYPTYSITLRFDGSTLPPALWWSTDGGTTLHSVPWDIPLGTLNPQPPTWDQLFATVTLPEGATSFLLYRDAQGLLPCDNPYNEDVVIDLSVAEWKRLAQWQCVEVP